jgi:catecholate siderophore receptor
MRVKIKLKRTKKPDRFRKPGYWMAMGALAACSATASGQSSLPPQKAGARGANPSPAEQTLPVVRFDIAAGTLEEATQAFSRATGWNVEIPDPRMRTLPSKGVAGVLPAAQALRQILSGTGLTYWVADPGSVLLQFEELRTSVEVSERTPLSWPRYTEPLRDLPQTVTVIPRQVIEQQGATSLTDVLRNVPGLTITAGEGGTPAGDNLTLRGYSARNDIFVDGVRDLNPQSRDPFSVEQVEVTKGPSSVVSGRGSAGGTVNLTTKGPNLARNLGGSFSYGNANTWRGTLDLNTPLSRLGLGERTAFRLNLLAHKAGVPGRNVVWNNRWGVAPSLAFGLGTPTRLTLSYYKLKQDNLSDYGIPWVPATNTALAAYPDKPAPVPRDTFYGFRNRDSEALDQDTATVRFEHSFSDSMQLRSQLRYGNAGRNSIATPPRFASNDSTAINREMRAWGAVDSIWDSQTDFIAQKRAFGIQHALVTGVAFTSERNARTVRTAPNSPTTLLNPNPDDTYTGVITTSPYEGRVTGNTQSLWAFETMKFGQHWEATGGLRWDRFNAYGVTTAPAPVSQEVNMPSIRTALIYKPVQQASIYAAYGTSMSPSLEGLSYSIANTAIPPEKTYTMETGAKWDVAGSRLLLAGALFRVAKDNARTPGLLPTDPPQVLAGRQVSSGVELSASGAITRSLRVLGAYTFIDARILSSNNPLEVGRFFQNTPRNSASVWLTYTARRYTFGLGPRFMGRRFGNNTNTRQVESYATLDAMASYQVNQHLDLRLNLANLNNAHYYERLGGGHLIPGTSRYVFGTVNFHF